MVLRILASTIVTPGTNFHHTLLRYSWPLALLIIGLAPTLPAQVAGSDDDDDELRTVRARVIEAFKNSNTGPPAAPVEGDPAPVRPTLIVPAPTPPAAAEPLAATATDQLIPIGEKLANRAKTAKPVSRAELLSSPAVAIAIDESPAPVLAARNHSSWRTRYELGPGDVLNFAMHGKPKLSQLAVAVAPDGTISYLQAKQIDVRGKTIDELRDEMNGVLAAYQRDAKLIITPAKLGSKRYTVLGEVRNNGTFPLERPTTLLNALALSGGFNLGTSGQDAVELADLRRSFIVRHGNRLDVDLESLYLKGDLRHNIQVEPGDYIYVASKLRNEIYVFGAVRAPGVMPMESGLTTVGAVAAAGGFTKDAWRDRVVVIRGRLDQPELLTAHLNKVFHGKESDFEVQPGDIVYVHNRPWAFAEKLLDTAILAYIDGAVAGALASDSGISVSAGR